MARLDKEFVWLHPHKQDYWHPGRVLKFNIEEKFYEVEDEEGNVSNVDEKNAVFVSRESLEGAADMINLGDFNEGTLLHNVRKRYTSDEIYTSIGSAILIAINPYRSLPIYTDHHRNLYSGKLAAEFEASPPHLFKMAEQAYQSMISEKKNQSIVITGESGAGKTESTKIVLRFLASVQKKEFSKTKSDDIEDKILYTNPVLEAFGNAKTVRNKNSSRFGKFIQIFFDNNHLIHSATISNYLLEKSRIVMQSPIERNYHIFYMFLNSAPAELRQKYLVNNKVQYPYVNTSYAEVEEFQNTDAEAWEDMLKCMHGLKVTENEKDGIFRIISAVLNLSNLNFKGNEEDSSLEEGNQYADRVSEVLGISLHNLENLLCFKAIIDPITKKKIPQNLSQNMAEYNRETFAKIIYDRLFDWIVSRVNIEIKKPLTGQAKNFKSIGLLDIFGFEVFESNSFEQLCINFTNEKLQHHFNEHVFSLEMAAYKAEGLSCEAVVFSDNSAIIKLIEGKPLSLFGLLDDQCKFANGSDDAFLEKALSSFKNEKAFLSGPRFKGKIFGVAHFAGDVYYDVTNFVEKNRNSKNKDLEEIMASSSVGFIADLFDESQKKGITTKPEVSKSISGQFLEQLEDLVKSLNSSACSYIRCIKPNESMSAKVFDSELVCKQLRCAGMLEAIRIRRSGFPIRRAFDTFVSLYKLLFFQFNVKIGGPRQAIDQFIEALDKKGIIRASDKHLQLGKTKVFMKEHVKNKLDALLEQSLTIFATRIQRWVKHILKRAILRKRFKSRLLIQRWWRALLLGREVRLQVQNRLLCIKKIQKFLKTKLIPFRLKQLNSAARQSKNHLSHQTSSEQPTAKKEPNSAKKQGKSGDIKNKFNEIIRKNKSGENGPGRLSSPISEQEGNIDATYDLEDEIESHPKYIQMQIELQKAKRELEVFRNNGQVQLSTNSAQLFAEKLKKNLESLKSLLLEKDNKLREAKRENEKQKKELFMKNDEISALQKEVKEAKLVYDDEVMTQLQQVDEIIQKKDRENALLRKKCEELKVTLHAIKENGQNNLDESCVVREQGELILELRRQIEQIQTESFFKESQFMLDEEKLSKRELYIQNLKEEASCSRSIVHDLIKLLKFKEFQAGRFQQIYEERVDESKAEELNSVYEKLKPQEISLRNRMMENMKKLQEIQAQSQVLEEETSEHEGELNINERMIPS